MNSAQLVIALVALSTRVMAAQITARPTDINSTESGATAISLAMSSEMLRGPDAAEHISDESMLVAAAAAPTADGDRTSVPEPAAIELGGFGAALAAIVMWHRKATQKTQRLFNRRRKMRREIACY